MKTLPTFSLWLLRGTAVVFASGSLAGFVWYSQVKAQRPAHATPPEKSATEEKSLVVISGSKSYSGPVTEGRRLVMSGSKSSTPLRHFATRAGTSQNKNQAQSAPVAPDPGWMPENAQGAQIPKELLLQHKISTSSQAEIQLPNLPPPISPKVALPEPKASGVPGSPKPDGQRSGVIMWGVKAPGGPPRE